MTPTRNPTVVRIIARMNTGGPAQHVAILAEGLTRHGFDHHLIFGSVESDESDMSHVLGDGSGDVFLVPELGRSIRPLADLRAVWKTFRYLRRVKPDVVHTHTAKAGLVGRAAAIAARVPVTMHTYHGHVFRGYFGPAQTRLFLGLEQLLAKKTDVLITLSPNLKTELLDDFGIGRQDQYRIMKLGLDLDVYSSEIPGDLKAELGLDPSVQLVGSVGRVVPIKDFDLLLKAFADVPRDDLHLAIAGDGECMADLRATAEERNIADRVHFLGWRDDIPNLMRSFDLFALTSKNEGTPVAIIEAMSAGTPVVATAVGGVADLLDHGLRGRLVESRDPAEFAQAMVAALESGAPDEQREETITAYGKERLVFEMRQLLVDMLDAREK